MYTEFSDEEDVAAFHGVKFPQALTATGPVERAGRVRGASWEARRRILGGSWRIRKGKSAPRWFERKGGGTDRWWLSWSTASLVRSMSIPPPRSCMCGYRRRFRIEPSRPRAAGCKGQPLEL